MQKKEERSAACHRLRVHLVHRAEANSNARIGHQMILMSSYKRNFTASVEFQADDLKLSTGLILSGPKGNGTIRVA